MAKHAVACESIMCAVRCQRPHRHALWTIVPSVSWHPVTRQALAASSVANQVIDTTLKPSLMDCYDIPFHDEAIDI
jgi:hypothetical protein